MTANTRPPSTSLKRSARTIPAESSGLQALVSRGDDRVALFFPNTTTRYRKVPGLCGDQVRAPAFGTVELPPVPRRKSRSAIFYSTRRSSTRPRSSITRRLLKGKSERALTRRSFCYRIGRSQFFLWRFDEAVDLPTES